jgi:hypothetical protein
MYGIVIVGIVMNVFISYTCNNMTYFGFATIIPLSMIAIREIHKSSNLLKSITALMVAISILFFISNLKTDYNSKIIEFSLSKKGRTTYVDMSQRFSNSEYKAMLWLRTNTTEDSVIASDRFTEWDEKSFDINNKSLGRWYYYSGFSYRKFFFEGTSYCGARSASERIKLYKLNNRLYSSEKEEAVKTAIQLKIDYIIVSKRIHSDYDFTTRKTYKCYSNEDIDIYRVIYDRR